MPVAAPVGVCLDMTSLEMRNRHGGIGRYALHLAECFAALPGSERRDLELYALTGSASNPVPVERALEECSRPKPEVRPRVHEFRRRVLSGFRLRASRMALFHSVDAAVLPWGAGCPIVSTSHDVIPLMGEAAGGAADRLRLASRRRQLRRSYRRAAHLIAVSEVTRQDIVRELGIPPERISVVHHGVDPRHFSPGADPGERERLRRAFALPDRWFLCVGSDHRRKNHGRLFEAWAESAGQLPEGLVIVGKALYRRSLQRLEAEAKRRGLSGGFRWLDQIDDGTLPALYRQATAAVAPSLYEGFGLTLLEAMACGTPIAVAANGAYREVGGDAVLYFDPFDTQEIRRALCRLSNDSVLRESLRARGLVRATHWSWERSATETLAVYRAVLAGQVA